MILQDIQSLFKIKIKSRDDTILDQYSRLFMVRLFLICAAVCGISWYADKLNCLVPGYVPDSDEFNEYAAVVETTCWIQGLYIYRDLANNTDDVAYYGITKDIDIDGRIAGSSELCGTDARLSGNKKKKSCIPMKKTFFLQYQYMPFLFGAIALLYYLPYLLHKVAAHDIIKLREETRKTQPETSPESIRKYFFRNPKVVSAVIPSDNYLQQRLLNSTRSRNESRKKLLCMRYFLSMLVQILYMTVNIGTFFLLDVILENNFSSFGSAWIKWSRLDHTDMYDYLGPRGHPKPSNTLLPPFGYCEVIASAKDIKEAYADKMKFVCEISQHVLYQYTFILLWLFIICGIFISLVALLVALYRLMSKVIGLRKFQEHPDNKKVFRSLTYREMEYLDYLQHHKPTMYGEVLDILRNEQIEIERKSQV